VRHQPVDNPANDDFSSYVVLVTPAHPHPGYTFFFVFTHLFFH
jgi:hypothetical protein